MKRISALVDYASSDDDQNEDPLTVPVPKKRKLPALASSLASAVPKDNPALHQGRVRSSPHVEGQFAAYVYVPLKLVTTGSLHSLLHKVVKRVEKEVPIIHPIGITNNLDSGDVEVESELHISLTRPIYLRSHQREDFKSALRTIAKAHSQFSASFATFSELTNDERTRTFLTVEIGAGHSELKTLCDAITPILHTFRQNKFYAEPRFHASVAWALLSGARAEAAVKTVTDEASTAPAYTPANVQAAGDTPSTDFPTIPHFPADMVSALEREFGPTLRSRNIGAFECDCLCVRIGKDVTTWKLAS